MTLEEEIITCLEVCGLLPDSRTEGAVQALMALIRQREKQWVEQVGRLKVDRHFAYLAQNEDHEQVVQERGKLHDQIEALQRQVWELESRLASYVPETESDKEEMHGDSMPLYRHDDETTPAPLMALPGCNDLIFQPIRFSHEEAQWLEVVQELNRLLIEELLVTPEQLGELENLHGYESREEAYRKEFWR